MPLNKNWIRTLGKNWIRILIYVKFCTTWFNKKFLLKWP
jgi:hypothetical protein